MILTPTPIHFSISNSLLSNAHNRKESVKSAMLSANFAFYFEAIFSFLYFEILSHPSASALCCYVFQSRLFIFPFSNFSIRLNHSNWELCIWDESILKCYLYVGISLIICCSSFCCCSAMFLSFILCYFKFWWAFELWFCKGYLKLAAGWLYFHIDFLFLQFPFSI